MMDMPFHGGRDKNQHGSTISTGTKARGSSSRFHSSQVFVPGATYFKSSDNLDSIFNVSGPSVNSLKMMQAATKFRDDHVDESLSDVNKEEEKEYLEDEVDLPMDDDFHDNELFLDEQKKNEVFYHDNDGEEQIYRIYQHHGAGSQRQAFMVKTQVDWSHGADIKSVKGGAQQEAHRCKEIGRCFLFLLVLGIVAGALVTVAKRSKMTRDTPPPIIESVTPTPSPSRMPAAPPLPSASLGITIWQEYRGSVGFGASCVILENWVAFGSSSQSSSVSTYYQSPDSFWHSVSVPSDTAGDNTWFGADLGMAFNSGLSSNPFLLVGAPRKSDMDVSGSAFLYQLNQASKSWTLMGGGALVPPIESLHSAPLFGSHVALSDFLRVVVGAPGIDASSTGQIFTYQYHKSLDFSSESSDAWTVKLAAPLNGDTQEFGAVFATTRDGNFLAVGDPGRNRLVIYNWENAGNRWVEYFTFEPPISDPDHGGDFGSSIVFLSPSILAVGAPSANSGAGSVSLFRLEEATGQWALLARLQGAHTGDRLGSKGTVNGSVFQGTTPQLVASTSQGVLHRYDLLLTKPCNHDLEFVQRFTISIDASVTSVDVEEADSTGGLVLLVGYGQQDFAALYGPLNAID